MQVLKHMTFGGKNLSPGDELSIKDMSPKVQFSMIERGLIEGTSVDIPSEAIVDAEKSDAKPVSIKSIEILRCDYREKFGNDVSNNKKNDSEWILNKLNS